ncbi:Uncharacterized protein FWK35_00006941 [Aphis craccivora]|uniref:Uncharacterized protein n=1 Tax=Aphis craccivora TaxID=307492 RepID=A0A6G0ZEB5_APHCR|nr:Uncharacterized protein FWK35_00006941 [Aphis craccivora]
MKDVSQQLKHQPKGLSGFSVLALPMTRLAIIQTSFQRSTRFFYDMVENKLHSKEQDERIAEAETRANLLVIAATD